MIRKDSPFKLRTHFRGWSRVLAIGTGLSFILNLYLIHTNIRQSSNFSTPRIIYQTPSGIVLPLAFGTFAWTPQVADDFISRFLPVLFTFSSKATPEFDAWSPFINPSLLKTMKERYLKNAEQIRSDGLDQTLKVVKSDYHADSETAYIQAEIRIIDRNGQLTRKPIQIAVELSTTADPLNPYGHIIQNIR